MMASTKKPVYKVETKLATDRKRRNSDLVIMWQSIWYATEFILQELWIMIIRMWELFQLWFISNERYAVQSWLDKYIPYVPDDFSESWRDGRLLAILLNNLRPGCFPDAKRLDPDYGLKNVYKVFATLRVHFAIKPNVSVEEIVMCTDESGSKLFEILLELKNLTDKQPEKEKEPKPEPKESIEQPITIENCIAQGPGLTAGFVGKIATFTLHCEVMTNLDVVIEIRGPSSICGERITKRSPKKKRSCCSLDNSRQLTRSLSFNEDCDGLVTEEEDNLGKRIIPFTYEIVGNNINLSYKPIEGGRHKVTILWNGRHVSKSPYFVAAEDPSEISDSNKLVHLKSALKASNECGKSDTGENSRRKISVRFQETAVNRKEQKNVAVKIVSRRVIRYIVKIYGKDIPVNAENTEALATELLKMDYDFEKCPSFHRRNSWGFTGDAERKKSVIRQFCVGVNELEAQISHRRSHSLSLNPGSKKLLQKYDSLENLSSRLNILSEDSFEDKSHEKEEDYAYINEDLPVEEKIVNGVRNSDNDNIGNELNTENKDFELSFEAATKRENFTDPSEDKQIVQEKKEDFLYVSENIPYEENKIDRIIRSGFVEVQYQSNTEKQISDLPSDLAEGKLVEDSIENNPSCEKDIDMISSLSTDNNFIKRIDSPNEDLKSRMLPCFSVLDVNERRTGNDIDKMSLTCQGSEMKMRPKDQSNEKSDSRLSTLQITLNSKAVRKNLKMKKRGNVKYDLSRFLKKCKTKNKSEYPSMQTFYKKSSKNKKSIYQSPMRILRRHQKNRRRNIVETTKVTSIVNGNILKVRHFAPPMQQRLENNCDAFISNDRNISKNTPDEFLTNTVINEENDEPIFEKKYSQRNEQQVISKEISTFKNILHCPSAEIDYRKSQNFVQEPTVTKSECNRNITEAQTTLSNNSKNKNSSFDNCIQAQTDSSKPIGQFYINHNFNSQFTSTKSEVDAKDTNIERTMPLRTHTLKTVGKFDFKQFSPPFETQNSISPVKLQIGLWESALSSEKYSSVEKVSSSDSEQVNIKEKLAFWENAYKTERKLSEHSSSRNNRKTGIIRSQKSCKPFDDNSEAVNNDVYDLRCKGLYSGTRFSPAQDKIESYNSMNKDTNVVAKKLSSDKVSTEFQLSPHNIRSRSFDDFVARGTFTEKPSMISGNSSSRESSKTEFSSASTDDNLEDYDSDHTEDSGGDYLLTSTGDEYIDDEIPESASEYWGDLSIVEDWKTRRSSDEDSFLQEQFLREFHQRYKFHTYPEECKVFGIAIYYGHVAVKNRFKVYTGDAGYGNLSVSMQGFRQHDVSLVSVAYMRNNIYEVTYQIMTTGYYLISIRWLDKEIPGSPFVCKVTF